MKVNEFIDVLKLNPQKTLSYSYGNEFTVLPFVHITEIKNHTIESVDCGGQQNKWNETVMQLWTGVNKDDAHRVDSSKALEIIERVNLIKPIANESLFLVEYGDQFHPVTHYEIHVDKISDSTINFVLTGQASQCKALTTDDSCCSSSTACCA